MMTTKSPVSTCGVKIVLSLPRNKLPAVTATWPSTWFLASITHHSRGTSLALAENVFITAEKARKLPDVPRSVKYSLQIRLTLSALCCVVGCSRLLAGEYPAVSNGEGVSASTVLREMNLARQDPALYATYLEALRSRFDGRFIIFPGRARWWMKEGMVGIEDAVIFHESAHSEPLTITTLG